VTTCKGNNAQKFVNAPTDTEALRLGGRTLRSRAAVNALEEAMGAGQRASRQHTLPALQPLLTRARAVHTALQADLVAAENERRLQQLEARLMCVVCMEAEKSVMLLPCTHMCMCEACTHRIRSAGGRAAQCPVCRQRIASTVQPKGL
jgi:tRNA(Ile2) C34 agmatinyltransferase TiaS